MAFDIGDTVPLGVDVKNAAGAAVNAGTVALTITLPDGTNVTPAPAPTNPSTGRYEYDFTPTQVGRHLVRWVSTGPNTAYTDVFDVTPTAADGIVSFAEAKDFLKIAVGDKTQDEAVRSLLGGITATIEDVVGAIRPSAVVERKSGGVWQLALNRGPVKSITSVTESGVTLSASDYSLNLGVLSRVAGYTALRWASGVDNVVITYQVGRTVVELQWIEAAKELLRINFRPQQGGNYSPFDREPSGSDDAGIWRLGYFVPHGVMRLLEPDARPPGSA